MTAQTGEGRLGRSSGKRVVCIGECMIELSHVDVGQLRMAFGGDTSNTAVYLARLTRRFGFKVDYVTALGDDAYSESMLAFWRGEGVGTGLVTRLPGRLPGIYTIRTDAGGERSFTYWRGQAAARDLLKDGRDINLASALSGVDLAYLSGITLSILDKEQRIALLGILAGLRHAGGKVAFDGNFRPAGWLDLNEARFWFDQCLGCTDIALPTLDDEQALFGGDTTASAVAARLHERGVAEVGVKLGARGCYLSTEGGGELIDTMPAEPVIDSTAAGDSFNAGYLGGRLVDLPPKDAARLGHRLAGEVVRHRGAIIPSDAMPKEVMAWP
ncbi:MAG: sugar kinase [Geminicoccaceae bacterium]